jgi:hypothetical protein
MKKTLLVNLAILLSLQLFSGTIEKTYYFSAYKIEKTGHFYRILFPGSLLSGLPGEPVLPYIQVALMLPPGESATDIEIKGEDEKVIPGVYELVPQQEVSPLSEEKPGKFLRKESVYRQTRDYPDEPGGKLFTQYLNGYAFALSCFTPVKYIPNTGTISFYRKMTVRITTRSSRQSVAALKNLSGSEAVISRISHFCQNSGMISRYQLPHSPSTAYNYLIIAPAIFQNEFQAFINMYAGKGIICHLKTVEEISSSVSGDDLQERIRNYIIQEYQNSGIAYVLLAGNPTLLPSRGFYCYVQSGGGYSDNSIPADLYYSGLDGNYDASADHTYGEVDDAPDLLPDISIGRFPVNDTSELRRLLHKTISYLTNPVPGEITKPLMVGEFLYGDPFTMGGPYMDLLINDHTDNGYFTHGFPSASNTIKKLYDTVTPSGGVWNWSPSLLLQRINEGRSFIHHNGHANTSYMLRLNLSDITNQNFAQINGIIHNYQLLYTQGCYDGSFDISGCIASKALTINNWLVGGIFNSRYGWFNEGTTEGPSEHLQREFVSAIYNDTIQEKHLGTAHMISKIKTAPWVTLPGEWEPGARRWVQYDCNVLGDPALEIWTEDPNEFTAKTWTGSVSSDWNNAGNWTPSGVPTSLNDVYIPASAPRYPVITVNALTICHDLILSGNSLFTVSQGKSATVWGSIIIGN